MGGDGATHVQPRADRRRSQRRDPALRPDRHSTGEIAVRTALGASRGGSSASSSSRLWSSPLAPAILGLALGQYAVDRQPDRALDPMGGAAPFWLEHGPQPSTMLYVLGLVVVTAAIAGILPALHATRRRGGADLRQLGGSTGPRLGRMWSALIVAQVAFAVAVLPAIKMGLNEIPQQPHATELSGRRIRRRRRRDGDRIEFPLGNRLLELRRRLQAEPEVTGVTFTGSLSPAQHHRTDRSGRHPGGRRLSDQRVQSA